MLSLVILLCMLTACDEEKHDDSEEITDYQHARVLISFGKIEQNKQCTLCYRCVNACPKQAITVFIHSKVTRQYNGPI